MTGGNRYIRAPVNILAPRRLGPPACPAPAASGRPH